MMDFKRQCGEDISKMLMDSLSEKNDSWYVRWAFDHFRKNCVAVFPAYSFIQNIGHSPDATHCKGINTYVSIPVDGGKLKFNFPTFQTMDAQACREFLVYFSMKYKIVIRVKLLYSRSGRRQLYQEFKLRVGQVMRKRIYYFKPKKKLR